MLTQEQIETFKERLLKEKAKTEGYMENREEVYDEGELSHYDNHPADSGEELFLRERDQALTELDEEFLTDVDKALLAIENGTYGKCEVCGEEIEIDRLEIIPEATLCIEHAREREAEEHKTDQERPVEEDVLDPSETARRKQLDGSDDINQSTDAFSQVEDFGSSDTIADSEGNHDPTRE
ncbi:TraR/DksA C4-type zinc finger protein [Exiguobacterium sp.]|uniref:TraR/DksA C4-type zinc finger protein n=1 Tax=Exiguobacterium sp. TaxID=44751 RepID=UPI00263B544F|nr:TraR/DksA C4-type zinc finger protein [Exiguobacterium sp.]MCC5893409.1 TraR/DksA C4-type zinc finger protein [Exiguobacterium sp.]